MLAMFNGEPIFGPRGPAGPDGNPIGTIISYMGLNAPTDYLICDGSIYNISDYSKLAEFFKTQFGSENYFGGDGTTTFAVPDMQSNSTSNPINIAVPYCIKATVAEPYENVYSTEETRIGTWINGKPLYRKIISGNSGSINRWTIISLIPNLENLANATGTIYSSGNQQEIFPTRDLGLELRGESEIVVYPYTNYYCNKPVIVIVEYTKTTDSTPTVSSVSTQSLFANSLNSAFQATEKVATSQVSLPSYATVAPVSTSSTKLKL